MNYPSMHSTEYVMKTIKFINVIHSTLLDITGCTVEDVNVMPKQVGVQ
jgi:hypothetical protein